MEAILSWYQSLSSFNQILFPYFIIINIFTFVLFGLDKAKAIFKMRRISEKHLWTMALLGGSVGALAATEFFAHKRRKGSFMGVLMLIVLVHAVLIILAMS